MPRHVTTLHIRHDSDGSVISVLDERGVCLRREEMRTLTAAIDAYYRGIGNAELESLIAATTEKWQREQQRKWSGEKPGYIYLFESYDGFIKIGQSKQPEKRAKEINMPYRPKLLHKMWTSNMDVTERFLHRKFAHRRCDGEWFVLTAEDLTWLMRRKTIEIEQAELEIEVRAAK